MQTPANEEVIEVGVDEAGRGPMMGRVYAAAVALPPPGGAFDHALMRDSKAIKSKRRMRELADYVRTHALAFRIEFVEADVVDEINVLQADMRCMHAAVRGVLEDLSDSQRRNTLVLVDGNYFASADPPLACTSILTVVGGDAKHTCISAASILAKDARDTYITELCAAYPELATRYGIDTNMGYGSARHRAGIAEHGISQFHRRTFGACRDAPLNTV
jgi:ribonuclease HII